MIWIGAGSTQNANIALVRRNADGSFTSFPAGSAVGMDALVTGPDGKLWFVGYGLLNSMTTSGTWAQFHITSNGNNVAVSTVARGPDGALWLGAIGGLGRYDIASNTTTWYTVQPPGAPIPLNPSGIIAGPDSRLYFGTFSGIVASDTSGAMSIVYQLNPGVIASAPLDFAPDGGLWFLTGTTQAGNTSWGRLAGGTEIPAPRLEHVAEPARTGEPRFAG